MRVIILIVTAMITFQCAIAANQTERLVLLQVQEKPNAWADSRICERLRTALTRDQAVSVAPLQAGQDREKFLARIPGLDSLLTWGREQGGQYLVCLWSVSERLERRKSFQVPLIFHKWEVVGVIDGEIRVIDLTRGKQVLAEPFEVELHGPRAIQATMDDTKNDPDLHISAPDKTQFMNQLEDKAITKLLLKIRPLIAKGDRELAIRPDLKKKP